MKIEDVERAVILIKAIRSFDDKIDAIRNSKKILFSYTTDQCGSIEMNPFDTLYYKEQEVIVEKIKSECIKILQEAREPFVEQLETL